MDTATDDAEPYWLWTWLESKKIETVSDAKVALGKRTALRELREVAELWTEFAFKPPSGLNLVAGAGLRLDHDDTLTCPGPECRRQQVDVLFRHAWHYFDRILLPDGAGHLLLKPPPNWNVQYQKKVLLGLIDIVLHIQELGARPLVSYYPSIAFSARILNATLSNQTEHWIEAWKEVEAILSAEAAYDIKRLGNSKALVCISDPLACISALFHLNFSEGSPKSDDILRAKATHNLIHSHMAQLERDLAAGHRLKGSTGSTLWSQELVLSLMNAVPDTCKAAFNVPFPTLENIPIHELIAVRLQNGDAFLAFRNSITKAAQEMCANSTSPDYCSIGEEIQSDVIEPELARLQRRLRTAKRTLARKSAVSITLTAIGTLCALQLGLLPAAAVGAISVTSGVAGLGSGASKYLDDRQAIELSDMYFIWKALQHAA